eukprot:1683960-Rhodomonas_salina.1
MRGGGPSSPTTGARGQRCSEAADRDGTSDLIEPLKYRPAINRHPTDSSGQHAAEGVAVGRPCECVRSHAPALACAQADADAASSEMQRLALRWADAKEPGMLPEPDMPAWYRSGLTCLHGTDLVRA